MMIKKRKEADLKFQYKRVLELGLVISLILHIILMQGYKKVVRHSQLQDVKMEALTVEDIPQTKQEKAAPAPSRPTVPIASEDEDLPEDETIDFTDLDLETEAPPQPPALDGGGDQPFFVAFDERPEPIGGWDRLQRNIVYPEIAIKAGIEGIVFVNAHIDVKGNVLHTQIGKSDNNILNQAAADAVKKTKWKPAMQRDKPVEVWVMIRVIFQLTNR